MNHNQLLQLIKKYLKKNHETVVIDLIIEDYNNSNFYMGLVFNSKIEKFKVLFIPLDIVLGKDIASYTCYQFIQVSLVNYILETLDKNKELYKLDSFRYRRKEEETSYRITIHTSVRGQKNSFEATKYIPKDWLFLFEIIVILFEHAPNIVNELCKDLLTLFQDSNMKDKKST